VLSKGDHPAEPLLLLTQKGHSWETLARQSNRTLLMEKGNGESLAKVWGAMLLADRQATRFDAYFSSVRLADKPHRVVLPVFFGQTDMCIVSRSAYDLMLELNPQIAAKLTILEQSPEFVNIIICATETLDEWAKAIIHEEILAMHTHAVGRQALTLIQMQRFWDCDPVMLKATEALYLWRQRNKAGDNG
jgi:phosphonate transport system substrate-binding protein